MKLLSSRRKDEDDGDSHEAKPAGEMVSRRRDRDLKLRSSSVHRKARSLSPLRKASFSVRRRKRRHSERGVEGMHSNRNVTKTYRLVWLRLRGRRLKWIFLNNLLHRSKSEGRANGKEKFWSNVSFSPSKEKKIKSQSLTFPRDEEKPLPEASEETQKYKQKSKTSPAAGTGRKPTNGIAKRRGLKPSAHELHYTTNRAQAEEMKKRTYLPYSHGLLGCLGFSSKGYSSLNGLARSLNSVSSK